MVNTDELRGIIYRNGLSQAKVAKILGISPKTFYEKMRRKIFGSDEIEIMIKELHIENPVEIFFCEKSNFKGY